MIKKKFFLFFDSEKKWLKKMNNEGYELVKAGPFTYQFEKTDVKLDYEYVFLKNGKKSYDNLDYKSKDPDAKAVYANAETALFKKPCDKGEFTIFQSLDEKKKNYLAKRSSLYTESICFLGATFMFLMLFSRQKMIIMLLFAIVTALLTLRSFVQSRLLDKCFREEMK